MTEATTTDSLGGSFSADRSHPRVGALQWPDLSRAISCSASIAVAVLATSVLAGWWFDSPLLKSGVPGLVAMNPVTAIAFIGASLSLGLLRAEPVPRRARLAAQACAGSVIVLALLSMSRFYTPWDLGPDRLLFGAQLAVTSTGLPNRMAPITGLCFLLIGVSLMFLDWRTGRGWRPAQIPATVAGLSGFMIILAYLYGSDLLYGVGRSMPMALNTAFGFVILSTGVRWTRPKDGLSALIMVEGPGGLLARRLLPAAVAIPLVLGWLRIRGEEVGFHDAAGGLALLVTAAIVIMAVLIWHSAVWLDRTDLARCRAEQSLWDLNERLDARVTERTDELQRAIEGLRVEEEERHRAMDELRALFEESPLAICSVTPDGYVRSWNRAAERLLGWSADEVIGRLLPIVPPDRLAEHERLLHWVLAGAALTGFETIHICKDGHLVDVSLSTAALHDPTGAVSGVIFVCRDMSERKVLEAQFRQAQKMEAVGLLAGGIAHDFNNLLTSIRMAAEFLLADLDDEDPRRADAAAIRDAASSAANLTRQLLAFSRRQVLDPRTLDLNAVVTEMEPLVRRLVEENIAVVTRLAGDLDRVKVDRNQLDQVILNLVVNARDAMPDGGTLLVETANVVLDEEYPGTHLSARRGRQVVLSVTDTGCGMDAPTQARLFEPFFTTKAVGHGTGLGLATVYGIVKQSGGHIWVYSEVGRGTSFKIYLPVCHDPEEGTAETHLSQGSLEDVTPEATILLVEDDVAVRNAVRRSLERHGYRVLASSGGAEALAVLLESTCAIDLVISDIVMPEMSGLELRHRLGELHPKLPVLLMSGYSEEAITRRGNQASAAPLIEKPFTVDGLLESVRKVLHA